MSSRTFHDEANQDALTLSIPLVLDTVTDANINQRLRLFSALEEDPDQIEISVDDDTIYADVHGYTEFTSDDDDEENQTGGVETTLLFGVFPTDDYDIEDNELTDWHDNPILLTTVELDGISYDVLAVYEEN